MHLHRYEYVKPILAGALLAASIAGSAEGEPPGAGYAQAWHPAPRPQSAQYCAQLLGTFDKFTASRATESSDGAHNHVRLGAEIECDRGDCDYCAIQMAALMKSKHMRPPAPPQEIGLAP